MKKIITTIEMLCLCFALFLGYALPLSAEETGCSTCNIEDSDGSIQKTIDDLLDYTNEEKNLVMNSVENSMYYQENSEFIKNSDRINVYKNDTADSYFTVSYIQKEENQITGTLIFEVNRDYEVEEVFGTDKNIEKSEIELKDYVKNTSTVYAIQPRVECYTIRCSRYETQGTTSSGNVTCELIVGVACNVALSWTGAVISSLVCYAGSIAACTAAPAGRYCAQMTRVNVCPY